MRLRNVVCVAMSTLAANALVAGTSCRDGVAAAVATEHAPVIDGDLSDWNLSAPVLVWNAEELAETELLFGIVNNQIGRAVLKRAKGNLREAARLVKGFDLTVSGSLGFDYAQVTKGGIPLSEVTENLESRFANGLYFAGEILDVDGQCGGFNLQWAYSSAMRVARALEGV